MAIASTSVSIAAISLWLGFRPATGSGWQRIVRGIRPDKAALQILDQRELKLKQPGQALTSSREAAVSTDSFADQGLVADWDVDLPGLATIGSREVLGLVTPAPGTSAARIAAFPRADSEAAPNEGAALLQQPM